jgi:tetratricopeptide (TPR) repeat protein
MKNKEPNLTSPNREITTNKTLIRILIIFLAAFLLYFKTSDYLLTNFDDTPILSKILLSRDSNPAIKAFTTDAFFEQSAHPYYRPLQTLSFIIEMNLHETKSTHYMHLTNLILFALIACSIYLLALKLKVEEKMAFGGTLLFSVHPVFVSSVAWLPARGDLLLTLFSVLSILFFISFLKEKNIRAMLLTWLCFSVALFSKETAAFIPIIFLLYFFTINQARKVVLKHLILATAMLGTGILWFYLRANATGLNTANTDYSVKPSDILLNFISIPSCLSQLLLPYDLASIPAYSIFKTTLGLVVLLLIIYLIFKKTETDKSTKLFFFGWFLILLIPTFSLRIIHLDYLEHRFLLPSIGILLLVLSTASGKILKSKWFVLLLLAGLSTITFFKTSAYANELSFFDATINYKGKMNIALFQRGQYRINSGEYAAAKEDFDQYLKLVPNDYQAYANRGSAEIGLNLFADAAKDFEKGLFLKNDDALLHNNLGYAKLMMNDYDTAEKELNLAIHYDKNLSLAYNNRSKLYYQRKDYKAALADLDKEFLITKNISVYYAKGLIYLSLNKWEDAINEFEKYLSQNQSNADVYHEAAKAYGITENHTKAILYFSKAIILNPNNEKIYFDRAVERYNHKEYSEAISDCDMALQIKPDYPLASSMKISAEKLLLK